MIYNFQVTFYLSCLSLCTLLYAEPLPNAKPNADAEADADADAKADPQQLHRALAGAVSRATPGATPHGRSAPEPRGYGHEQCTVVYESQCKTVFSQDCQTRQEVNHTPKK